jgi:hypothetical protein
MFIKLTYLGEVGMPQKKLAERFRKQEKPKILLPIDQIKICTMAFPSNGALAKTSVVEYGAESPIYVCETLEEIQDQLAGVTLSAEPPGETIESLKVKLALLSASTAEMLATMRAAAVSETSDYHDDMMDRAEYHLINAQKALRNTPEQP